MRNVSKDRMYSLYGWFRIVNVYTKTFKLYDRQRVNACLYIPFTDRVGDELKLQSALISVCPSVCLLNRLTFDLDRLHMYGS